MNKSEMRRVPEEATRTGERRERKIKVKDFVVVPVYGGDSVDTVLNGYPGYVVYDRQKHNVDGVEVTKEPLTQALPVAYCEIVKE